MTTTRLPVFTLAPTPEHTTPALRADRDPGQAWNVTQRISFDYNAACEAMRTYR